MSITEGGLAEIDIASIQVEKTKFGFVVWVYEEIVVKGKKKRVRRYWLMDGSLVTKTGEINLGDPKLLNKYYVKSVKTRFRHQLIIKKRK